LAGVIPSTAGRKTRINKIETHIDFLKPPLPAPGSTPTFTGGIGFAIAGPNFFQIPKRYWEMEERRLLARDL
jgi:hypothetical protein